MLRSELVTLIENRLGSRTGLTARIVAEANLVQSHTLEKGDFLPWFLINAQYVSTAVGDESVEVPSGFLREYDEGGIWVENDDGSWTQLEKDSYDTLAADTDLTEDLGVPTHYALAGGDIYLFPAVETAGRIKVLGYYADTLLSAVTDTTNLWLTHAADLMAALAGRNVAAFLRDGEMLQLFAAEAQAAKARLITDTVARAQAAFRAYVGG